MLKDKKPKNGTEETNKEKTAKEDCEEAAAEETCDETAAKETADETAENTKEDGDKKPSEADKLKDQLLRQMAEYDNYRKRTARERMELESDITARTVTEFLPVIDNLGRALAAECADPNYKKGIEMICTSFEETLKKLGVEAIAAEGEMFNPAYHQAVQQVESDELESGTIANEFQKGYKIGEKVIRFSMVAVVR